MLCTSPPHHTIQLQSIRSYCEKSHSKPYDVKKYLWTRNRNMVRQHVTHMPLLMFHA